MFRTSPLVGSRKGDGAKGYGCRRVGPWRWGGCFGSRGYDLPVGVFKTWLVGISKMNLFFSSSVIIY